MSRGFTDATKKPWCTVVRVEAFNVSEETKKHGKCAATSKLCSPSSSTSTSSCTRSTHHVDKTSQKNVQAGGFPSSSYLLLGARDRICSKQELGSCIMTMHQLICHIWFRGYWKNIALLAFFRLPALQTWLLAISGSFPSWKCRRKEPDFESREEILRNTTACGRTSFQKQRHSNSASSNCRTAG